MRLIFKLWILVFSTTCFSQNGEIEGKIISHFNSEIFPGASLIILGTNHSTQSDFYGNYSLKDIKAGKYDIEVEFVNFAKDTLQNIEITDGKTTELVIKLPLDCYPKNKKRICPQGEHRNNIIQIIYGLPSEKQMKRAKKGKLKLGNCVVTGCEPNWYCKIHKTEF